MDFFILYECNHTTTKMESKTKAQLKEETIREAMRIASEKKAKEDEKKALKKGEKKDKQKSTSDPHEEALLRRKKEKEEKEEEERLKKEALTLEARELSRTQRMTDLKKREKHIKQLEAQYKYDKANGIVYTCSGQPLTVAESAQARAIASGKLKESDLSSHI
jgi:hypothetical protein